MNERKQIKILAVDLKVGDTLATVCPFCEAEHENSLYITRNEQGLLYNCFRASCPAKGFISSLPGSFNVKQEAKAGKKKIFTRPLKQLPDGAYRFFYKKYGITKEEIDKNGFLYDYTEHRMYMPVFDYFGHEVGVSCKAFDKKRKPKVINYWPDGLAHLHFPRTDVVGGVVVLVEDTLSSIKVARHARSAALGGTSMLPSMAAELQKVTKDIVVALDSDTWSGGTSKAHKIKEEYGLYFRNFYIAKLSNDPKDMTDDEIREVILGGIRE